MKKSLLLLTSLLATGSAIAPLLTHEVSTQKNVNSTDIVDLTMPWWNSVEVQLPNLVETLNANFGHGVQSTTMSLTSKDNKNITWNGSAFDVSTLRFILLQADAQFTGIKLEIHNQVPFSGTVMSYWQRPGSKPDAKVIGRFSWPKDFDMSSYWTKDTKFEFGLVI